MELRPIRAALLAGRSASRCATTAPLPLSYPLVPSFYRCFSSTRPALSEAEAAAPAPLPSMQEWNQQQQQQQQQRPQQHPQQPQPGQPPLPQAWASPAGNTSTNSPLGGFASLLRPNQSSTSSSPSSLPPTSRPSDDNRLNNPWAVPTSPGLKRSQANRAANEGSSKPGIFNTLYDMGLTTPSANDLIGTSTMFSESASEIKYRLRPSVGRTVHLDTKVDLARGLGLLNARVRINRVQSDVVKQRFHERPGMKRKRLRSERWRARFKYGFKATCSRVQELARQGW